MLRTSQIMRPPGGPSPAHPKMLSSLSLKKPSSGVSSWSHDSTAFLMYSGASMGVFRWDCAGC